VINAGIAVNAVSADSADNARLREQDKSILTALVVVC
jgi:hypothetical protein